jgi:hypothetical protein
MPESTGREVKEAQKSPFFCLCRNPVKKVQGGFYREMTVWQSN